MAYCSSNPQCIKQSNSLSRVATLILKSLNMGELNSCPEISVWTDARGHYSLVLVNFIRQREDCDKRVS
jgi:hypothetical protein